jgi:SNF2 family DNA or RNA helicase
VLLLLLTRVELIRIRHLYYGQLRTAIYHGLHRHLLAPQFNEYDVILTTYETLRLDRQAEGPIYQHQWRRLVLDEGQKLILANGYQNTELVSSAPHPQ